MKQFSTGLSVLLLSCLLLACGDDTSSEDHLNQAKAFLGQAEYNSAIIELKNVLQKDINNAEARWLLGRTYYELGDNASAEKELSRAFDAGMDKDTVVPLLAQVLLTRREFEKLDAVSLEGLSPETRSSVLAAKGLSMFQRDNTEEGTSLIEEAVANSPASPYSLVAAARLLMIEPEVKKARDELQRAFAIDPDYRPAWSLLGDIESGENNLELADQAYTKAIDSTTGGFDALLKRAMVRISQSDFDAAKKDIAQLKKVSRKHPGVNFADGIVRLRRNNTEKARESFEKASLYDDAYPLAFYYLAVIDLSQGNQLRAFDNAAKFLTMRPDSVMGAKLVAKLEMEQSNFGRAETLLRAVVASNPDDVEALNLLANTLFGLGKSEEGLGVLTRVAELQPDSPEAQARLGAGFIATGEESLGIEKLQTILQNDPNYQQADILIVLNHLRKEDYEAATQAAQDYRERNPQSVTSHNLLGRVYLASKNTEQAKTAYIKAAELAPGDPEANHRLAGFSLQDKDYDSARNYYQEVLKHHPDNLQTQMQIAASYALQGDQESMVASLEKTIRAHPQSATPRLVLARYYLAKGKSEQSEAMFEALSEEQRELPDVLAVEAGMQLDSGSYNQAMATLDKLILLRPDIAQFHYLKGKAAAALGDTATTESELQKALELDPDHFYTKAALARLALVTNKGEQFEQYLAELKKTAPENPAVIELEVVSAQRRGDNDYALHLLEMLYEKDPTTKSLISLAQQRQVVGDLSGAISLTQTWLGAHGDDIAAREKLAELYSRNKQTDMTVKQYQEVLKIDKDRDVALNNLAWYLRHEDPKKALVYAKRADKLSPDSASILDTLAIVLMANNKLPEARRTIDQALELVPDSPDLRFHELQIRAAEGDTDGAKRALVSLLEKHPKFSERNEAEKFLKQLK